MSRSIISSHSLIELQKFYAGKKILNSTLFRTLEIRCHLLKINDCNSDNCPIEESMCVCVWEGGVLPSRHFSRGICQFLTKILTLNLNMVLINNFGEFGSIIFSLSRVSDWLQILLYRHYKTILERNAWDLITLMFHYSCYYNFSVTDHEL